VWVCQHQPSFLFYGGGTQKTPGCQKSSALKNLAIFNTGLRKVQAAGIKFTHRSKITFFSLHRWLVAPWNLAWLTGMRVRLAVQHCTSISTRRWESSPQNIKNFHFLVKNCPRGQTPWSISNSFKGFYAHHYPASASNLTWFASQVMELLLRNRASVIQGEFFRALCTKNYMLDRKIIANFLMVSTCSITMQSSGKIVQRAPAVGAKMWCLYVSLFFVTLWGWRAVRSRGYTLNRFVSLFIGRFRCCFQHFSEWIALSDGLDSSHFCC